MTAEEYGEQALRLVQYWMSEGISLISASEMERAFSRMFGKAIREAKGHVSPEDRDYITPEHRAEVLVSWFKDGVSLETIRDGIAGTIRNAERGNHGS